MSSLAIAWEAIRPVPVTKNGIVEPEATDKYPPRPWLRWPPGAAFLVIACAAMIFMAAFQTSVAVVRTEGIRGGLADVEDNLQDELPIEIPLPAFVHPGKLATAASKDTANGATAHHRHHRRRTAKLRRLLQQNGGANSGTAWSHDAEPEVPSAIPAN